MELTEEVKAYIDQSVLCWLATVSSDKIPNVSPKECFTYFEERQHHHSKHCFSAKRSKY